MIRVLIADDQPMIRDGLAMILSASDDIEVVATASDGAAAIRAVREHRPDVVLMDIRMPNVDGIEATRTVLERGEGAPRVLVLTTFEVDEYVFDALRAGASGFLMKSGPTDELLDAVRQVAAGDAVLAPSVTRRLIGEFVRVSPRSRASPAAHDALSAREQEVLRLIGQGLSNAEVARALVISPATAKSHVASIIAKLGVRDRLQAVIRAYESGLLTPGDE